VYDNLWRLVFDLSKRNGRLTFDELQLYAKDAGLIGLFSGFPVLSPDDQYRESESKAILARHENSAINFVYGLSGTGKSTVVAQALRERETLKRAFWFSTGPSYDSKYFRQMLGLFLEGAGHEQHASVLRDPRVTDADATAYALAQLDMTLIFDTVEKASSSMEILWSTLIRDKLSSIPQSKIIFVGQQLSRWFQEAQAYVKSSETYEVPGFSYADFMSYLGDLPDSIDEARVLEFYNRTGGLPIAAALLKAGFGKESQPQNLQVVVDQSADAIHRMLFSNVISRLDDIEREFVESASVFESEFSLDEVNIVLERPLKSRAKVLALLPRCVVNERENGIQLHDSVRPLAYELLLPEVAQAYHEKLATHYTGLIQDQGFLFELIHKWAYHVRRCEKSQSPFMKAVIGLSQYEVFSLWGIHYGGFPFSFSAEELAEQQLLINKFVEEGLVTVSVNYDEENGTFDIAAPKEIFKLKTTDQWDRSFLWHVAERETPAYHMGYIDVNDPNFAWQLQRHTICPWEHRIEYEPLMPYDEPPADVRAWFADVIRGGGLSWRGPEANAKTLAQLDELIVQPDIQDDDIRLHAAVGSCPMFGHCCPGGSDQAAACRVAF
jgi:hypothetical protein